MFRDWLVLNVPFWRLKFREDLLPRCELLDDHLRKR